VIKFFETHQFSPGFVVGRKNLEILSSENEWNLFSPIAGNGQKA
jgi:hypothetical protein